jgi:pyruvate formate lyase activating enzyme
MSTETAPQDLVDEAVRRGATSIVSTYNEPLITAEWAVEVFKLARRAGLVTGFVSNGNGTPEVIDYLRPWVDLYKVDLKGFDEKHYRQLGGRLQPILDTVRSLHEKGFWLELVTLLVPGFNSSDEELRDLTAFVASVSPWIPWHVTAYHEDYKMGGTGNTTVEMLQRAARIGMEAGLKFVYAGNIPGAVGGLENTRCPSCSELLVERVGYRVKQYRLTLDGTCPSCRAAIPGRWQ